MIGSWRPFRVSFALLKIIVPTIEDYEQFVWHRLSKIAGVQEVMSSISMSQPVNSTRLPVKSTVAA